MAQLPLWNECFPCLLQEVVECAYPLMNPGIVPGWDGFSTPHQHKSYHQTVPGPTNQISTWDKTVLAILPACSIKHSKVTPSPPHVTVQCVLPRWTKKTHRHKLNGTPHHLAFSHQKGNSQQNISSTLSHLLLIPNNEFQAQATSASSMVNQPPFAESQHHHLPENTLVKRLVVFMEEPFSENFTSKHQSSKPFLAIVINSKVSTYHNPSFPFESCPFLFFVKSFHITRQDGESWQEECKVRKSNAAPILPMLQNAMFCSKY